MCSEHVEQTGETSDKTQSLHELHATTSVTQEPRATKSGNSKKRKFDDSYIKFGFISVGDENAPDGQCVECTQVLGNSSLNPAKLRRHLEAKQPHLVNKHSDYFVRKRDQLKKDIASIKRFAYQDNKNALEASYRVSYHIAKAGEAHTIAESLLKPCMKDVVSCMLGEKYSKILDTVSLSNDTVSRRIKEMADNCETVLINRIKTSPVGFTIQLDESTDVAGLAVLLVFVRYVSDESVHEDLLLCQTLETTTRGEDIFKILDTFFTKNDLRWELCIGVCTDGAKAMTGTVKGVISLIRNVAPDVEHRHYCLHREALAVKKMSSDLEETLNEVIKIVNFIKARPLHSRVFASFCQEMGSIHKTLLLHTEVRWLSRGKILSRVFELRNEIEVFLREHKSSLSGQFTDEVWLCKVAYLADIFLKLNDLNLSLQGSVINILNVQDRIKSFLLKIEFWIGCVKKRQIECLPNCHAFLKENSLQLTDSTKDCMIMHLKQLMHNLREYFPKQPDPLTWLRNPFMDADNVMKQNLSVTEKEQLIEISSDFTLKTNYNQNSLFPFWINLLPEYPELSKRALQHLMPFATTYMCEAAFSRYIATKNKYRSKLDAAPDIRLQLTNIVPNFDGLCCRKQAHPSH